MVLIVVCGHEVGHDAHVLRQIQLSALILQTGREEILVGIVSADDLHHGKALGLAVGCQFLKAFPGHALAQVFPSRVAEPEERRTIGVFEMTLVFGHAQRAMFEQRIVALVGCAERFCSFPFRPVFALLVLISSPLP
jgi:hypothetical protein